MLRYLDAKTHRFVKTREAKRILDGTAKKPREIYAKNIEYKWEARRQAEQLTLLLASAKPSAREQERQHELEELQSLEDGNYYDQEGRTGEEVGDYRRPSESEDLEYEDIEFGEQEYWTP